jgi:tetratricopeptide (TPR) repeat protein
MGMGEDVSVRAAWPHCPPGRGRRPVSRFVSCALLPALALALLVGAAPVRAAEPSLPAVGHSEPSAPQARLWAEAEAFVATGNVEQAALYFRHYWRTYPQSPRAAEALWQAAQLSKQQALAAVDPDWSRVRELFQAYIVDYATSPLIAEAYAEMGDTYFHMGFYREAQNYYNLFLKHYPNHGAASRVLHMRARTHLHVGRFSQASEDFAVLRQSKDRDFRLKGEAGLAYVHFFQGQWHDALGIFKKMHRQNPDYYLLAPETLRDMGVALIRVGSVDEGRQYILRYLNVGPQAQDDEEAFFEMAESYLQEGVLDGARAFYDMVAAKARPGDKYAILGAFRLAQYGAANLDKMSERERLAFFKKNGDKPFQEVLDALYDDPLAQDARYSLFRRYVDRRELELAYNLGKSYLRYTTTATEQAEVEEELGAILVGWITTLLAEEKYDEIRRFYEKDYAIIAAYKKAELLVLIGQAYERQTLYDQASVIYYRALAREIGDEQKAQLYFRRAEVYLANNDLQSAQRLLKYLRRIYQGQGAIAEVNWLSARLRLRQGRAADALEFYKMAVESGSGQQRRGIYADDYLRQLFAQDALASVADLLAMFHEQQWLAPRQLQHWYGRLGSALVKAGKRSEAVACYRRALAQGMPATSPESQPIHLQLGDLLMARQKPQEALGHYRLAQAGQDKTMAHLAETRLNDYEIRGIVAEVKPML